QEGEDSAWRTPQATTRIRRSHPLPDVRSWFLLLPRTAFAGVVRLRQADRITRTAIGVGQRSLRGCRQYSRPDTTIAARHDPQASPQREEGIVGKHRDGGHDGSRKAKSLRKHDKGPGKAGSAEAEPLKRKEFEKKLKKLHVELVKLQQWVQHKGLKICIVFEGRDGAGKGGTIKAITERVSPRVFRVIAL